MHESNPKAKGGRASGKNAARSQRIEFSRRSFLTGAAGLALTTRLLEPGKMGAEPETNRQGNGTYGPPVIEQQGSFFVGGRTVTGTGTFNPEQNPFLSVNDGDTFWIDQLYVQFRIPPAARTLPIVMVHGGNQTGKSWESTPDGRDGYQTIFVRKGFATYVVDFPRRGKAGFPSFTGSIGNLTGTQILPDQTIRIGSKVSFMVFRLGPTPFTYFPNSQFPKTGFDQFNMQAVPDVTDDPDVVSDAIAALCDQIGPAILVTHSQSGQFGWLAAMKTQNVKAIVAYEPEVFYFPTGALPTLPPLSDGSVLPFAVPIDLADFQKLTRIPIQIVYGDNIPTNPVPTLSLDLWRVVTAAANDFISAINSSGGDASILSLPSIGIFGNTHFAFSDLNNLEVADRLSAFLHLKNLDS